MEERKQEERNQKWGLKEWAEVCGIIGIFLVILGLVFGDNWYQRWRDTPPAPHASRAPEPSPTPLAEPSDQPSDTLPYRQPEVGSAPVETRPSTEPDKEKPQPSPSAPSIVTTPPPSEPLPPSARTSEPAISKPLFLLGRWRLSDESCLDARQFSVTDGIIEISDSRRALFYTSRILQTSRAEVTVSDGSRFVLDGGKLHHVDSKKYIVYFRC